MGAGKNAWNSKKTDGQIMVWDVWWRRTVEEGEGEKRPEKRGDEDKKRGVKEGSG